LWPFYPDAKVFQRAVAGSVIELLRGLGLQHVMLLLNWNTDLMMMAQFEDELIERAFGPIEEDAC
jgi:hypothetical protein